MNEEFTGVPGGRYRYNGLLSVGGVYITKLRIGSCDTWNPTVNDVHTLIYVHIHIKCISNQHQ